jgi:hypothetical protein
VDDPAVSFVHPVFAKLHTDPAAIRGNSVTWSHGIERALVRESFAKQVQNKQDKRIAENSRTNEKDWRELCASSEERNSERLVSVVSEILKALDERPGNNFPVAPARMFQLMPLQSEHFALFQNADALL